MGDAQLPLAINSSDPEVAALHQNLESLGFTIPEGEIPRRGTDDPHVFGIATMAAVRQVQANAGLLQTGVVDEATQLAIASALGGSKSGPSIQGQIRYQSGRPADRITVGLYKRGFGSDASFVAKTETDAFGFYTLPYRAEDAGISFDVRVMPPNEAPPVPISAIKLRPAQHDILNLVAPAELEPVTVEHTLLSADLAAVLNANAPAPSKQPLARLAEAQEKGEQRDISYLRDVTGWDARLIALAATAQQQSAPEETGIPAPVLYALYRTGLPMDKQQLARITPTAIEAAITRAKEAHIVELDDVGTADALNAFAAFAANERMTTVFPGAISSPEELLQLSGLEKPRPGRRGATQPAKTPQDIFRDLLVSHTGTTDQFWCDVKKALPNDYQRLQAQGELARLTFNNGPLIASLMKPDTPRDRHDLAVVSPDTMHRLVDARLYRKDAWVKQITVLGDGNADLSAFIPPAYIGETAQRLDAYASDMARKVRLMFPTRVAAQMLVADGDNPPELTIEGHNQAAVSEFLLTAETIGFKLGQMRVDTFLENEANAAAVFPANTPPDKKAATIDGVKAVQRIFQMTPSTESLMAVSRLGLTSATQVASIPFETFLERHGTAFPSPAEAELVYLKAEQISGATRRILGEAQVLAMTPAIPVLGGIQQRRDAIANIRDTFPALKTFPNLEGLFGELDYCECDHCHSVLSPAAYLVDILKFLDPDPEGEEWKSVIQKWGQKVNPAAVEGNPDFLPYPFPNLDAWKAHTQEHPDAQPSDTNKTPYQVLMERRPDLPQLRLTCENSLTALPYIDVVNEVLEYFVASTRQGATETWDNLPAYDTGDATTAELLAEPQNTLSTAYDVLRRAQYPLSLPFDLWFETTRRFFDHFGTPLWQASRIFRTEYSLFPANPASPDRSVVWSDIFREYLGLSPDAADIFTRPHPLWTWFELYGYRDQGTAFAKLHVFEDQDTAPASAKALARRLDVTYTELTALLNTAFVNPAIGDFILLHKLEISASDLVRYKLGPISESEKHDFESHLDDITKTIHSDLPVGEWLQRRWDAGVFDHLLMLDPPKDDECNFDKTMLRFARLVDATDENREYALVYLKLNLFVRLWRALGWTIDEVDRALAVFIPERHRALQPGDLAPAFQTALIYLAHLKRLQSQTKLGTDSLRALLILWSDLPTVGNDSLYFKLFLSRNAIGKVPEFDHPLNQYLHYFDASQDDYLPFHWTPGQQENPATGNVALQTHLLSVQGAMNLSADEIAQILEDNGSRIDIAPLDLVHISLLYRYRVLAKGLGLSIKELIAIKALCNLDPFHALEPGPLSSLDDDHPFSQTLAFISVVDRIKASEFQVEDLEYLFRHRFDPVGRFRVDDAALLALTKKLAAGLGQIAGATSTPADVTNFSDDQLRQFLALLHDPDVVDTFFSLWTMAEFAVKESSVPESAQLHPQDFAHDPAIRVVYDPPSQTQQLFYKGILTPAEKVRLATAHHPPLVFRLLTEIQEQQKPLRGYFGKHFGDYLSVDSDFDRLFAPTELDPDATDLQRQTAIEEKRRLLLLALLPRVQRELARRFVVETLAPEMAADAPLLMTLLTDTQLISDPSTAGGALLDAFADVTASGVSVHFYPSADGTGDPIKDAPAILSTTDSALTVDNQSVRPATAQSVRFAGYLEVPEQADYTFRVTGGDDGSIFELRLLDRHDPILVHTAGPADRQFDAPATTLKPGVPYAFVFSVSRLASSDVALQVQGGKLPMDRLSQLTLYPAAPIERAARARTILAKALQLIQGLSLTERELRYFARHHTNFADFNFSNLPTDDHISLAESRKLVEWFLRLLDYSRLRDEMAGGADDVIDVFELARRPPSAFPEAETPQAVNATFLDALATRIGELTRRDGSVVRETITALRTTVVALPGQDLFAPALLDERGLRRLWDALQMVDRFGVLAASLARWIRPAPGSATADDLRRTVRARYDHETWQRVAPSIFDPLRQRQRDALVAHVLHHLEGRGIERLEQLFEFFLIDPGMEPVVQTSRLRLALSSVQLFVQRCLLNLEPAVPAAALTRATDWQWMSRYRVWEANRKIFLYPENWLEPEFRDDKSFLYQALEGRLLQEDVTDDLAEDAFLDYLRGLAVLARLDIVTCCVDSGKWHVIGRTFSEPHKYFYRRFADGEWTPWEPVTAEIEGDHVVAVVWRSRLYLFWAKFMPKPGNPEGMLAGVNTPADFEGEYVGANSAGYAKANTVSANISAKVASVYASGGGIAGETTINDLQAKDVKVAATTVFKSQAWDIVLNWSDLFQGQWSTREATSTGTGAVITAPAGFDVRNVYVRATVEPVGGSDVVKIHFHGPKDTTALVIAGRNSTPHRTVAARFSDPPYNVKRDKAVQRTSATQYEGDGSLTVTYVHTTAKDPSVAAEEPTSDPILGKSIGGFTLLPLPGSAPKSDSTKLGDRFFYSDDANTFLVTPNPEINPDTKWVPEPGDHHKDPWQIIDVPHLEWQKPHPAWPGPGPGPDPGPERPYGPIIDQTIYPVTPATDWLTNDASVLRFGDSMLTRDGSLDVVELAMADVAGRVAPVITVVAGSDMRSGTVLVATSTADLGRVNAGTTVGGIAVVGNGGLNPTLAESIASHAASTAVVPNATVAINR